MARNTTVLDAEIDDVFGVFLDAAKYPAWIAGTKRLSRIESNWPDSGSAFWITFAGGMREDKTEVVDVRPPQRVVLRPHIRPFGVTRVVLELKRRGANTEVSFTETLEWPTQPRILRSIADRLLFVRNIEALRRLKRLVEQTSRDE